MEGRSHQVFFQQSEFQCDGISNPILQLLQVIQNLPSVFSLFMVLAANGIYQPAGCSALLLNNLVYPWLDEPNSNREEPYKEKLTNVIT